MHELSPQVWILRSNVATATCASSSNVRNAYVPAEAFPTLATLIRLLSRMDPPVEGKREMPDKGLATLVGYLARVVDLVHRPG